MTFTSIWCMIIEQPVQAFFDCVLHMFLSSVISWMILCSLIKGSPADCKTNSRWLMKLSEVLLYSCLTCPRAMHVNCQYVFVKGDDKNICHNVHHDNSFRTVWPATQKLTTAVPLKDCFCWGNGRSSPWRYAGESKFGQFFRYSQCCATDEALSHAREWKYHEGTTWKPKSCLGYYKEARCLPGS